MADLSSTLKRKASEEESEKYIPEEQNYHQPSETTDKPKKKKKKHMREDLLYPFAIRNRKEYFASLPTVLPSQSSTDATSNGDTTPTGSSSNNVLRNYFSSQRATPKKIPKGWLQTEPLIGENIPNTMFIPFKCPLSPQLFPFPNNISLGLLKGHFMREHQQNIGLVIDLCCAEFYKRNDVPENVEYQSYYLNVHHFNKVSNLDSMKVQLDGITSNIDRFIERCPNKYILIHCTHGLNRTGFVICYYMLKKRIVTTVEKSMELFKLHRKSAVGLYNPFFIDLLYEIFEQTDSSTYQTMNYPSPMPHSRKSILDELKTYKPWTKRANQEICISTYEMLNFLQEDTSSSADAAQAEY